MKKGYKFDRVLTRPGGMGHPFYGGGRQRVDPDGTENADTVLRVKVTKSLELLIRSKAAEWFPTKDGKGNYSDLIRTCLWEGIGRRLSDERALLEHDDYPIVAGRVEEADAPITGGNRYWCEACLSAFNKVSIYDVEPCPHCGALAETDTIPF